MQNGNLTLSIPVSPVYPGPEGSGLNLQLIAFYNSNNWRYERKIMTWPEDADPNVGYYMDDVVDYEKMYFSPVGFGWQLHMGRIFRMKKKFGDNCSSIQYYYEDPSGGMHDFGPYM